MALLRYRTRELFQGGRPAGERRMANSALNREEADRGEPFPRSLPRRLVFELTNDCNLSCRMCGRFDADFKKTYFDPEWLALFEPIFPDIEEVTLMGWGEPTMHPHFPEILRLLHRYGVRIYFCTNGMTLRALRDDIFANQVDIIAVSLDGPAAGKNAAIRRGADFSLITGGIADIVAEKRRLGVSYPYMNFVTTLQAANLRDFPAMVKLAADLGLEEAKAVYLTVFAERLLEQSLWGRRTEVEEVFAESIKLADELGVNLKLPAVQGEDPAGGASHQLCHQAWRDFFLGSDGYARPCMSTPLKFFHISEFDNFASMWRHPALAEFRRTVNVEGAMDAACARCYQSSYANWNRKESFIRTGGDFAPEWKDRQRTQPTGKKNKNS